MKKLLFTTLAVFLLTGITWPPTIFAANVTERWTCQPPTMGSPAVAYQWGWYPVSAPQDTVFLGGEIGAVEPEWPIASLTYPEMLEIRIVARARDTLGRWGPWASSDPYMFDLGPPGGCSLFGKVDD